MSLVDFDLQGSSKSGGESTDSLSSKAETQLEAESPSSKKASSDQQTFDQTYLQPLPGQQQLEMASDNIRTGPSQNQSVAKQPLEKVLSFATLLILVLLSSLLTSQELGTKGGVFYYCCMTTILSPSSHC